MADLPAGTITLLFTDIEGSTRLWEAQSEAMATALARHDFVMRRCIEERHGHVFKTVGDAFFAAFHTAPDALAAALDAQRAMHRESWPEGAVLRVRMALHSGAVETRDGDYFGAPLNRVARLLAAGHGGQTLLSAIAYDLCRDRLPVDAIVRPLGLHGLKDLGRVETLYQVSDRDLPQAFPPLRTALAPLERASPSIAVLPFVNMSRDEENEFFADGLAEELLNLLAKIRNLRVASRTSAFSFKGKDVDIGTVARKLNVATILEGSVRKAGKRVRITAQLIEVATDSHLWSQTYDRDLDDIFAVQDDIAQAVVTELREALMGQPAEAAAGTAAAVVRAAATGRSENPEAFQLFLQAKFAGERITRESTDRAIALFQRAIEVEPTFALAWAELANMHQTQAGFAFAPIEEGIAKARQAALRSLEIAPDLAEGHLALGFILQSHDWDWEAAGASLQRALELAPSDASALRGSAVHAHIIGRVDDAVELIRRAVALDPLSPRVHRQAALIAMMAGRLDEAAASVQMAIDLAPNAGMAHGLFSIVRLLQYRLDEALTLAKAESHLVFRNAALAIICQRLALPTEAEAALRHLLDDFPDTAAFQIAEIYATRDDLDTAFRWLDRAYELRDSGLMFVATDPHLRSLHRDPRWGTLLDRMNLR
jgi:TolB-like protein/class 3 adenylate cyclase/tetratricopeptide (TPR) repeat protein